MAKSLLHDLRHHASDKMEVAQFIALVFASMLNPQGWQAAKFGKGNNSWRLFHPHRPGQVWYFTGYQKGEIMVRNAYFWKDATKRFAIRSLSDALRWAKAVTKT